MRHHVRDALREEHRVFMKETSVQVTEIKAENPTDFNAFGIYLKGANYTNSFKETSDAELCLVVRTVVRVNRRWSELHASVRPARSWTRTTGFVRSVSRCVSHARAGSDRPGQPCAPP